jgi:hypothetical protein
MMRGGTPRADGALSQGRAPLFFCEKQTTQPLFSASQSIATTPMWCNGSECPESVLHCGFVEIMDTGKSH